MYSVIDPSWDLYIRFGYLLLTYCLVAACLDDGDLRAAILGDTVPFFCFTVYSPSFTLDPVRSFHLGFDGFLSTWFYTMGSVRLHSDIVVCRI